jgi:hypothetical protein
MKAQVEGENAASGGDEESDAGGDDNF